MRTPQDGSRGGARRRAPAAPYLTLALLLLTPANATALGDLPVDAPEPVADALPPAGLMPPHAARPLPAVETAVVVAAPDEGAGVRARAASPVPWTPAKRDVNATPAPLFLDARIDPAREGVLIDTTRADRPESGSRADVSPIERALAPFERLDPRMRSETAALRSALAQVVAAAAPALAAQGPAERPSPVLHAQAIAPPAPEPLDAQHAMTLAAGALLLLMAPWILYHHLRGHRVLANPTRARLFDLVQANPGAGAAELARNVGLDRTTVRYHLRRLEREGLVAAEGAAHFAAGALPREARAAHVAAQRAQRVLDAVRTFPGSTKHELAQAVGLARATVCWHLDRLAAARLVRLDRDGRAVRAWPREDELRGAGLN